MRRILFGAIMLGAATAASAAKAVSVELPTRQVYAGQAPARIRAVLGDTSLTIVAGKEFRITSRPKATGTRTKAQLEDLAREAKVLYDPAKGTIAVSAPFMLIGWVNLNIVVELPSPAEVEIKGEDSKVSLEKVTLRGFTVTTQDGSVSLSDVVNEGASRVITQDGDVEILAGAEKLGKIVPVIKGDGHLSVGAARAPIGAGSLEIATKDGNIRIQ